MYFTYFQIHMLDIRVLFPSNTQTVRSVIQQMHPKAISAIPLMMIRSHKCCMDLPSLIQMPSPHGALCIPSRTILLYQTHGFMSMMTARARSQINQGQNTWQALRVNHFGNHESFMWSHIYLVTVTHTRLMKHMFMVKKVISMLFLEVQILEIFTLKAILSTFTQLRYLVMKIFKCTLHCYTYMFKITIDHCLGIFFVYNINLLSYNINS